MKPGRPRLDDDDESINVNVRMPSRKYDQLCEEARRQQVSVPEVIRRQLDRPPKKNS